MKKTVGRCYLSLSFGRAGGLENYPPFKTNRSRLLPAINLSGFYCLFAVCFREGTRLQISKRTTKKCWCHTMPTSKREVQSLPTWGSLGRFQSFVAGHTWAKRWRGHGSQRKATTVAFKTPHWGILELCSLLRLAWGGWKKFLKICPQMAV